MIISIFFESFVKVVDAFKPVIFRFENVPGLLSASPDSNACYRRILRHSIRWDTK
jgi:DNA (cytosine-5)-methyltransferase 1